MCLAHCSSPISHMTGNLRLRLQNGVCLVSDECHVSDSEVFLGVSAGSVSIWCSRVMRRARLHISCSLVAYSLKLLYSCSLFSTTYMPTNADPWSSHPFAAIRGRQSFHLENLSIGMNQSIKSTLARTSLGDYQSRPNGSKIW